MTHNTNVKRYGVVVTKQMTYKFGCAIRLMVREIKHPSPQQGDWVIRPIGFIKIIFKYVIHPDHHKEIIMTTGVADSIASFFNRPTNLLTTYLVYTNKTSVCPLPKYCIISLIP